MEKTGSFYQRAGLGKHIQPASAGLLAWLRQVGASEALLPAFGDSLREDVEEFPLVFLAESELLRVNAPGTGGLCCGIAQGLLVVGASALSGDPVVIDLRDPAGAGGYLNHETMWSAADLRGEIWRAAHSWEQLAVLIDQCKFPSNYHDAKQSGPPGT